MHVNARNAQEEMRGGTWRVHAHRVERNARAQTRPSWCEASASLSALAHRTMGLGTEHSGFTEADVEPASWETPAMGDGA